MGIDKSIISEIVDNFNQLPRKSEVDTPTNNIDTLADSQSDGMLSALHYRILEAIENGEDIGTPVDPNNITGVVPISKGGTNANTPVLARSNLNTLPYVNFGGDGAGYFKGFEIEYTDTASLQIALTSTNARIIFTLLLTKSDTGVDKPVVKLIGSPFGTHIKRVFDRLVIAQTNDKACIWLNLGNDESIKVKMAVFQVTTNYDTDEFDSIIPADDNDTYVASDYVSEYTFTECLYIGPNDLDGLSDRINDLGDDFDYFLNEFEKTLNNLP